MNEVLPGEPRDGCRGQAYTEYVVLMTFGILLAFGIVIVEREILPEQLRVLDRLYGYIFQYYASLADYLNLPFF